jgi:hypothetical protein
MKLLDIISVSRRFIKHFPTRQTIEHAYTDTWIGAA